MYTSSKFTMPKQKEIASLPLEYATWRGFLYYGRYLVVSQTNCISPKFLLSYLHNTAVGETLTSAVTIETLFFVGISSLPILFFTSLYDIGIFHSTYSLPLVQPWRPDASKVLRERPRVRRLHPRRNHVGDVDAQLLQERTQHHPMRCCQVARLAGVGLDVEQEG